VKAQSSNDDDIKEGTLMERSSLEESFESNIKTDRPQIRL
jgi:hypothetical protein